MGQRGPKPTPLAVKALTGARIRTAADLGDGVHPEVRVPTMPKHLIGPARTEWKRIAPLLIELRLLTELDRAALTMYCQAWGELVTLQQQINAEMREACEAGKPDTSALWARLPSGIARPSVLVKLRDDAEARTERMLGHFGLSPSQRSRVTASRASGQQALPGMEVPADPVAARLLHLRAVQ